MQKIKTKRKPLTVRSYIANDDGVYAELESLTLAERAKAMQRIGRTAITASAQYHGYTVEFEGNTAVLTPR